MLKAEHKSQYSYDPEKFLLAGNSLLEEVTAETSKSFQDDLLNDHPELKELHLKGMLEDIYESTGGKVSYGGAPAVSLVEPKDSGVLFYFDAIYNLTKKSYNEEELAKIDEFAYFASTIQNFTDGNSEYLQNEFIDGSEIELSDEEMKTYCEYVKESSQHLIKSLMKWLTKESGINSEKYLENIEAVKEREEDDFTIIDEILLGSAFKAELDNSANKAAENNEPHSETLGTSCIPRGKRPFERIIDSLGIGNIMDLS